MSHVCASTIDKVVQMVNCLCLEMGFFCWSLYYFVIVLIFNVIVVVNIVVSMVNVIVNGLVGRRLCCFVIEYL